jgi:tetratricopeptide (TPR) repeat protein
MADVFVSYARGDEALARKIARQLTDAGFSAWWDSELLPHNRFANVIEDEIRAAKAVLVIWSKTSVKSQWVRAEAELGRGEGKLVQVAIDDSPIPLPFNQFQAANLRHWRGSAADPQWRKVLASIAHFAAQPSPDPAPVRASKRVPPSRAAALGATAAAVLALAIGGVFVVRHFEAGPERGARIAVQPFRTIGAAPVLADFAAGLSNSLQNVLSQDQLQTLSPAEADTLKGTDLAARSKALGVGLLFSGAARTSGPDLDVTMRLDDPVQQATLWTAEMSAPAAQSDQLQARVGALTVAVLNCAAQGLTPKAGLSDPALQVFLHACELSETSDHGQSDTRSAFAMLDAMRQTTREAPDFAAGHSVLAKHLAFVALFLPDQAASLRAEALREAHRALALDPRDPDAFVTLGLLASPFDYAEREAEYRKALASDPAWPHANGFLALVMSDVGRLQDAQLLFDRAAAVNPQSIDWTQEVARGLMRIGGAREADRELDSFAQLWPDNSEIWQLQFESKVVQKDWGDALKILGRSDQFSGSISSDWVAQWRELVTTLQSGDPAARAALRQKLIASASADPAPQHQIMALAMLGFTDDAFAVAQNYRPSPGDGSDSSFLFFPETAPLRNDPRFMGLAERFRLVDYWRRTGRWPDFCQQPGLPYNCKEAAAKFAPPARP